MFSQSHNVLTSAVSGTWLRMQPVLPWVFSTRLKMGKFQLLSWLIRGSSPGITGLSGSETGLSWKMKVIKKQKRMWKWIPLVLHCISLNYQIHSLKYLCNEKKRKTNKPSPLSPLAMTGVDEERWPLLDTPCNLPSLQAASCFLLPPPHFVQSRCCHCGWSHRCCRRCCHSLTKLLRAHLGRHSWH